MDRYNSYPPRVMLKTVIFGYLSNIYSCRKIEDAVKDRITFMWLAGGLEPDHNTVNRFRSRHLKDTINEIFTPVVTMPVEMGYLSLDAAYIDGTKMESRANRYTFVRRKTVEKNRARLEAKIRKVLEYIEEGIMQDNKADYEPPTPVNSAELKKRMAAINRENRNKEEQKEIKTLENKYLPKLEEYEKHLETLGNRNSCSKNDPDATFMHLKDDHMQNRQLKPAYNL